MNPFQIILTLAISLVVLAICIGFGWFVHRRLLALYENRPHQQFHRQLIMVGVVLLCVLVAILLMPIGGEMRGQLLGLFGIILSATIALSSTTLVGNVMAGIMLRTVGNMRPGDYIRVGDYFGRISEMDLMHTEIQTEERDLTTLPNMYMVTNPVRVMRTSGTILSVEVSLGYDVSRHQIEELLLQAAGKCGLESPFVQIRNLGDYSITYVISGLLTDLKQLISKRRELRATTVDLLHKADIEIASPTLMSTRAFDNQYAFRPEVHLDIETDSFGVGPDSIVFDKAEQAESVANLREKQASLEAELKECEAVLKEATQPHQIEAATAKKENIEKRILRFQQLINRKEANISQQ